jgi:hypothetical protein
LRYVFDSKEDYCNGKEAIQGQGSDTSLKEIVAKLRQVHVLALRGQNMEDAIRQSRARLLFVVFALKISQQEFCNLIEY